MRPEFTAGPAAAPGQSVWQATVLSIESDERLIGRYVELARLSTSPRFNKPQRAILEDDAAEIREVLESRGMTFGEPPSPTEQALRHIANTGTSAGVQ